MSNAYHIPVMLTECIEALSINPKGVYVDVTYGGGGHSKAILDALAKEGRLIAFDQDEDAIKNSVKDKRLLFCPVNFKYLRQYCLYHGFEKVDGILADLGVSSYQINEADRGFSFRFGNALLDMRMNKQAELSAYTVVNTYSVEAISAVLSNYGEIKNAWAMANTICDARKQNTIDTAAQLEEVLKKYIKPHTRNKQLAQVFQAIRIEVNQELKALESFLLQTIDVLKPKARLVIMSYHSLEDRLVKNVMNTGNVDGDRITDAFGKSEAPFFQITRKPIMATEEELAQNPRARSAKLRIASRND